MNSRKILTITLITLLIAGTLIWWQMDKKSGENSNENQENEKALFLYTAYFSYQNSTHKEPLENLALGFPAPNIENKTSTIQLYSLGWKLKYVNKENTIHREMVENATGDITTHEFKGNRSTPLQILQGPGLGTGLTIQYQLSELYPREQFKIYYRVMVDSENADKLTLQKKRENQKSDAFYNWPRGSAENKKIDLYFDVKLMQPISENQTQLIERFVRYYENGDSSWYWLYPPVK